MPDSTAIPTISPIRPHGVEDLNLPDLSYENWELPEDLPEGLSTPEEVTALELRALSQDSDLTFQDDDKYYSLRGYLAENESEVDLAQQEHLRNPTPEPRARYLELIHKSSDLYQRIWATQRGHLVGACQVAKGY